MPSDNTTPRLHDGYINESELEERRSTAEAEPSNVTTTPRSNELGRCPTGKSTMHGSRDSPNSEYNTAKEKQETMLPNQGHLPHPCSYAGLQTNNVAAQGYIFDSAVDKPRARPWRTTFLRFGPISGIFAMLFAIASIFASLGILAQSNKEAVASWTTPPSTYLAIFTAIANLSMRYACTSFLQ